MNDYQENELEISEYSYKKAVLAAKVVEHAGDSKELVKLLERQAEVCLSNENSLKRSFGIHVLRFLYKKGRIDIGWSLKRKLGNMLKSDKSESVRLAAFDLLGAILARTGSRSGVQDSHFASILGFREKMLERSSALRKYESTWVNTDIKSFSTGGSVQETVTQIISGLE